MTTGTASVSSGRGGWLFLLQVSYIGVGQDLKQTDTAAGREICLPEIAKPGL